jgi:adenylate kinase family enzyme
VIRERLEAYERQTRPVLEFLRQAGRRVEEVAAGVESPEWVFERICGIVANHDRA